MICFWSSEEETKLPGSVAESSGHHITSKLESDLGPWNFSSWETIELLALYMYSLEKLIGVCHQYLYVDIILFNADAFLFYAKCC